MDKLQESVARALGWTKPLAVWRNPDMVEREIVGDDSGFLQEFVSEQGVIQLTAATPEQRLEAALRVLGEL